MENLRPIIAENLIKLRLKNKMTQAELAQKLNYTDKSVSKWENCESLPSIDILKNIADIYGVTVDYLITSNHDNYDRLYNHEKNKTNKLVITLLSVCLVWLITITLFFFELSTSNNPNAWKLFVAAVPVSIVILIVFNSIWGKKRLNYILISIGIWSLLATIFLALLNNNKIWTIFILGIPLQIVTILWSQLKTTR